MKKTRSEQLCSENMSQEAKVKKIYPHGNQMTGVAIMFISMFLALLLIVNYLKSSQLYDLVFGTICAGLGLFSLNVVVTKISIYTDSVYLYINSCQPIIFKKRYRVKRSEILKLMVDTKRISSGYGPIDNHQVVLITKNGKKFHILTRNNEQEAIAIQKELSMLCLKL